MFQERMKDQDRDHLLIKINNGYDKLKNCIFVFLNGGYNIT